MRWDEVAHRSSFLSGEDTGREPIPKNWSYYKRVGSIWNDIDHVPPSRRRLFLRPDLDERAAQMIGKRHQQEMHMLTLRKSWLTMQREIGQYRLKDKHQAAQRQERIIGTYFQDRLPEDYGCSTVRTEPFKIATSHGRRGHKFVEHEDFRGLTFAPYTRPSTGSPSKTHWADPVSSDPLNVDRPGDEDPAAMTALTADIDRFEAALPALLSQKRKVVGMDS